MLHLHAVDRQGLILPSIKAGLTATPLAVGSCKTQPTCLTVSLKNQERGCNTKGLLQQ